MGFGEGFDGGEHVGVGGVMMREAEFRDRESECRHQLLIDMNCIAGNLYVEQWRIGGERTRMLVFVAMCRDQIGAVDRTIDRDFTLLTAADGADFFAFGGAKSLCFTVVADWAGHGQQNTLDGVKIKSRGAVSNPD
jgi:hypothetical protein